MLRRWLILRDGRRVERQLPDPARPDREPAWLMLCSTVACKVGRCPANTVHELGTRLPAVELVARVELELDDLRSEWRREELELQRAGRSVGAHELRRREREGKRAEVLLARVRETRAYRRGMAYLTRELAWCARLDPVFREWAREQK